MAPGLDEQAHWDAVKALLSATKLGDDVYALGMVPGSNGNLGTLPRLYAEIQIARRYVPNRRLVRLTYTTGWRVTVVFVGDLADNARTVGSWVAQALDNATVTIDGHTSSLFQHETSGSVKPDVGLFSGYHAFTYSL